MGIHSDRSRPVSHQLVSVSGWEISSWTQSWVCGADGAETSQPSKGTFGVGEYLATKISPYSVATRLPIPPKLPFFGI